MTNESAILKYAAMNPKYSGLYSIKNSPEFEKALGVFSFYAEKVLRRTFYSLTVKDRKCTISWEQKSTAELENIERECDEAVKRYKKEVGEVYDYRGYIIHPITEGLFFEQPWETLVEMQHFFTTKAIFDYVTGFDGFSCEEKFHEFQSIAILITDSIELIGLEAEAEEIGIRARIENARKAGLAKQSRYEKAGTIAAVNKLLEEKKEMLDKRGGKAELTRLIIRKIENDEINAPDIPTEKTVMKWIANFQKQEVI